MLHQSRKIARALEFLRSGGEKSDLPQHNGRVDLRDLPLSDPMLKNVRTFHGHEIGELSEELILRKVSLEHIDFSRSKLPCASISQSAIVNCKFERADCRRLRLASTRLESCTFEGTDLSESTLGIVLPGLVMNVFKGCEFVRAKMRMCSCTAARFEECRFEECNVADSSFGGSSFINTYFTGKVDGATFWGRFPLAGRDLHESGELPESHYRGLNFQQADLHSGFRQLYDDSGIDWPDDPDLLVIEGYAQLLDDVLRWIKTCKMAHVGPAMYLEERRKTAGRIGLERVSKLRSSKEAMTTEDVQTLVAMFRARARAR